MKVTKDGNVKLEAYEIRIGNFFVKKERDHIKIQDINAVFSYRANTRMPIGIWLENMWDGVKKGESGAEVTLKTYIAMMWSFFSVAPDNDFVKDVLRITEDALNRHPDWYGIKKDATAEEDAEAAREVKEMREFEDEVKDAIRKEDGE